MSERVQIVSKMPEMIPIVNIFTDGVSHQLYLSRKN